MITQNTLTLEDFNLSLSQTEGMLVAKERYGVAHAVIFGSILGDGHLQANENCDRQMGDPELLKTVRFRESHGLTQKAYCYEKYEILKPFFKSSKAEKGPYLADKDRAYNMFSIRMQAFVPYFRYFYEKKN